MRPTLLSLLLVGCSAAPPSPPRLLGSEPYPGVLRAVETLPHDFLWRQRVTVRWTGGEEGFDAALQKRGGTLTLVGLGPYDTPAFVLTWNGREIGFENRTDRALPFPPRYILLDVQRVFFPWLPPGQATGEVDGERITERLEGDVLLRRTFERLDGQPPGAITVTYEGDRAILDNGWFGYTLTVETSDRQRLTD